MLPTDTLLPMREMNFWMEFVGIYGLEGREVPRFRDVEAWDMRLEACLDAKST